MSPDVAGQPNPKTGWELAASTWNMGWMEVEREERQLQEKRACTQTVSHSTSWDISQAKNGVK